MIKLHCSSTSKGQVLNASYDAHVCHKFVCYKVKVLKEKQAIEAWRAGIQNGNIVVVPIERIGSLYLAFPSSYSITLMDVCFTPCEARNIISKMHMWTMDITLTFEISGNLLQSLSMSWHLK